MQSSLVLSLLASLTFSGLATPSASAQSTERVNVQASGVQGDAASSGSSISADGRLVGFYSEASNLVPGDTNGVSDVFVHDRRTGRTTRVSVDSGGLQGDGTCFSPRLSADGRFVSFHSNASNLVPGDTNNSADVFVHDLSTRLTTRVSVDSLGVQGSYRSYSPSISSDGRLVAFYSLASNLVPGDTNGVSDVFVHDRQTGITTRVSVDSGGLQGNNRSMNPDISPDGKFVAFESNASNFVPGDTNNESDIFIHDRQTGLTTRVSVDSGGLEGNDWSYWPRLSAAGGLVAFRSSASNLVPGDTNSETDIFVHDRQTGMTTRVSVDSLGVQGNLASYDPSISSDGRLVAFYSNASNLVSGDVNGTWDVFVHDRLTAETTCASVNALGHNGNDRSQWPSLSADGRFVAFGSDATNLVPGDTNTFPDVFVRDRRAIAPALAIQGGCPGPVTVTLAAATPEGGVAFAYGAAGSSTLNTSACAGTVLDLATPQLGAVIRASWLGTIQRAFQAPPAMCGLTLQALDLHSCRTSNTVVL